MEQVYTPNPYIPYVGGWCAGYVEGTAKQATIPTPKNPTTSGVWNNAVAPVNPGETAAWAANYMNGNHPGELPPKGFIVPVFFSLGSTPAGHEALMLEDGRVASSSLEGYHTAPYIYPNLNALIADYAKYNNGCTYLGWSEYIGKQQVVRSNMITDATKVYYLRKGIYAEDKPVSDTDPDVGKDYAAVAESYLDYANKNGFSYWQYKSKSDKQVAELNQEVEELKNKPPQTIIKEVVVEKVVIKEVNVADKYRTFWDLIKAAFNKLGEK